MRLLQKLDMKRRRGSSQPRLPQGLSTVCLACCCKHILSLMFFYQPAVGWHWHVRKRALCMAGRQIPPQKHPRCNEQAQ